MHCARFWHRVGSQVYIHDSFRLVPSRIRHGHSSCMSCTYLNHLMAIRQLQFSCQVRRARCNHFRDRSTRHTYSPAPRLSDDFSFDTLQKHTEKSLLLRVAHWQPAPHVHGPCERRRCTQGCWLHLCSRQLKNAAGCCGMNPNISANWHQDLAPSESIRPARTGPRGPPPTCTPRPQLSTCSSSCESGRLFPQSSTIAMRYSPQNTFRPHAGSPHAAADARCSLQPWRHMHINAALRGHARGPASAHCIARKRKRHR